MWLRGQLWSSSGERQGLDSLRQCLTEIRKALGPAAEMLITDRGSIGFNRELVRIETPSPDAAAELCADLDLPDPQFRKWLEGQREKLARRESPPVLRETRQAPPSVIVFALAHDVPEAAKWVHQTLREAMSLLLRAGGDIEIVSEDRPIDPVDRRFHSYFYVTIEVNQLGDSVVVSTRLERGPRGALLWNSGQTWLVNDGSDESIWRVQKLAFSSHEKLADAVANAEGDTPQDETAFALAVRGRNRLFEFNRAALIDADRLFARAYELEPRGAFLAWRHFTRNTALFEHLSDDFLEPMDRIDLIEQAIIDNPDSALVLALASQDAFVRKNDLGLARALVGDSIEQSAVNPLGLAFQSNIHILGGEHDKAIQAATQAHSLVKGEPYRGFWSMFLCMAHMAKGDYETAGLHASMSHYMMPRMVAAQRFLYALNEAMGRETQAQTVFRKIRQREPDFTKQVLFRNDYPVGTMRRTGIMELLS